jgi:hypothetical protein
MPILVKGGRNGMDAGNLCYESASSLEAVDDVTGQLYADRFDEVRTVEDMKAVLQDMIDNQYNIVGTYDRVFHSGRMLGVVEHLERKREQMDSEDQFIAQQNWVLFTRGCNLRRAAAVAFNVMSVEESKSIVAQG